MPPTTPRRIHWLVRLLAFFVALLGLAVVAFAIWALVFDLKMGVIGVFASLGTGLFTTGVFGWIAVFGRVGPKSHLHQRKVPLPVRIWAGAICLLSPAVCWLTIQAHAFSATDGFELFNAIAGGAVGIYILLVLARVCISGYWPYSVLRFTRLANMSWREQLADTRREHEHRRNF